MKDPQNLNPALPPGSMAHYLRLRVLEAVNSNHECQEALYAWSLLGLHLFLTTTPPFSFLEHLSPFRDSQTRHGYLSDITFMHLWISLLILLKCKLWFRKSAEAKTLYFKKPQGDSSVAAAQRLANIKTKQNKTKKLNPAFLFKLEYLEQQIHPIGFCS